jgi:DNA mismatch repair protein MSH3
VDELDSVDDLEKYSPPFMCLVEEKAAKSSADVSIGMITICPSTGDVVWDLFEGKNMITFLTSWAEPSF